MASFIAICWFLLLTAKLIVAPPELIPFPFHPACYDTDPPIVQQNVGNLTCSGKCLLGAANVQILQWPPETNETTPNAASMTVAPVASGIVSSGVTFISPSVYIAYHVLGAFISCPTVGYIARGKSYDTTIAYKPEDLSTSISARDQQACAFSEINYTKLANYPFSNKTEFILSLPGALTLIDTAWSTCAPASYGAFDPPRTLGKATALTNPTIDPTSSTPATPRGSVAIAHGPATMTSSATSSRSEVPLTAPKVAAPHTTKLLRTDSAKSADPAINQGSHNNAASESPSNTLSSKSPSEGQKPKPDHHLKFPPAPGKDGNDEGYRTENNQNILSKSATAPGPGKDGPHRLDPTKNKQSASPGEFEATIDSITKVQPSSHSSDLRNLVDGRPITQAPNRVAVVESTTHTSGSASQIYHVTLAVESSAAIIHDSSTATSVINDQSVTRAPNSGSPIASPSIDPRIHTSISNDNLSAGTSEAIKGDNTRLIQTPFTTVNFIHVNPSSSADEVRIGSHITSPDGPAVTKTNGAIVSPDTPGKGLNTNSSEFPATTATSSARATAVFTDLITSGLDAGRSPIAAGSNDSKSVGYAGGSNTASEPAGFARGSHNASNARTFTGGSPRSSHDCSSLTSVLSAMAAIAMAF